MAAFLGTMGEVEAGVGLQSHPSVYSPHWLKQELGRGGESLCSCLSVHAPQVAGPAQGGWGQGSVCRAARQLCVITEDIPVVQEEHTPEACPLVTFLSAVSAFRVSADEVETEQGRWREADLNLNPGTSTLSCGSGLVRGFFLSLCFLIS